MAQNRGNRGTIRQRAPYGGKPMEVNDGGRDAPQAGDGRRILLTALGVLVFIVVIAVVASLV